jgi:uncharacterized coiled-coil DUF342 family protein
MAATRQDDKKVEYVTSRQVQAWFLKRSRDNWKAKYGKLKAEAKGLQNRVYDVAKSREEWRKEAKEQDRRVRELEATIAALQEQLAAEKKTGPSDGTGSA